MPWVQRNPPTSARLEQKGPPPRCCQRVDLAVEGKTLHLFNVHLGTAFRERRDQAERLAAIVNQRRIKAPKIVLGDFNEWSRGLATAVLEEKLRATAAVARDSGGTLAWASTFDARGFEEPGFAGRTADRLRRTFDEGAVGVKIWKNIGMAIRAKSGAYLLPDDAALLPVYEAIERAGKTLVAHLAEPDGAWMPLDDRNPELPYYSKNPQWHMPGKGAPPV